MRDTEKLNKSWDVKHLDHLSERIGTLSLNPEYSDITFLVEDERLPAHKAVLACSSEYFRYRVRFMIPTKMSYFETKKSD